MSITNESELRTALWNLPPEGGVVEFEGTISLTSTIVLGNGSEFKRSDFNGITLRGKGSGVVEQDMGLGKSSAPSKLVWNGPPGGVMIQFAGPVSGIVLENFALDCNNLASTAIDSVRCFNSIIHNIIIRSWTDGYALIISANSMFNGQGLGGGGAPHHCLYSMIYITDPGSNASGIQIAPNPGGNVNQITFQRCTVHYSDDMDSVGLDLGFTDHISFYSCYFGVWGGTLGNSIQVTPPLNPSGYNNWPQNILFYDCPFTGGIKLNGNWVKRANSALSFFPYYTADSQALPPIAADGTILPLGLVTGFTDHGERLGLLARGESRLIFSSQTSSLPVTNLDTDLKPFNNSKEIYSELLQIGGIVRFKASGRVTKPLTDYQIIEIRFHLDGVLLSAAHLEISNTHDGYLWHAESEAVVLNRVILESPTTPTERIVMRRNGGNLSLGFANNGTAWTPGIFSVSMDQKLKAEVLAKWHNLTPSGCSIMMDSFTCEMVQG